jgi:hypothetical protein
MALAPTGNEVSHLNYIKTFIIFLYYPVAAGRDYRILYKVSLRGSPEGFELIERIVVGFSQGDEKARRTFFVGQRTCSPVPDSQSQLQLCRFYVYTVQLSSVIVSSEEIL